MVLGVHKLYDKLLSDYQLDIEYIKKVGRSTMSKFQEVSNTIWVTFQKEAIHKYPAALTDPNLADVSFLGYPHRHIIFFKVAIEVMHNDRDVEFLQFKRWLESLYNDSVLQLDYLSMEMIADQLAEKIYDKYPNRKLAISVAEDNENGCLKSYHPVP